MAWVLPLLFFASGAAALVFEIVWFHLTGLVFGNSVWAASVVLASFMGGLALGNHFAGRRGARIARLVRAYALLEAVIAGTGVALTLGLPLLPQALAPLFRPLLDTPWSMNLVRLALAFLLLLIPTTAMGATLPLLVAAVCRKGDAFGPALGRLYGLNTLGAMTGVVLAETVLIGWLGIRGTGLAAAALNIMVAGLGLWISRRHEARPGSMPPSAPPRPAGVDAPPTSAGIPAAALFPAAFLSGAALLALEVLWFRFLSMFVINNTLAWSIMLAVVLAGIGLGGLTAAAALQRGLSAGGALPTTALVAAAATVLTYAGFQLGLGEVPPFAWSPMLTMSLRLILPVAWISGFLFTLQGQALRDVATDDARAAGRLTLANTLGAMSGSWLGGFFLLPYLGMERSFFALALVYVGIAILVLVRKPAAAPLGFRVAASTGSTNPATGPGSAGSPARTWRAAYVVIPAAAVVLLLSLFPFGLMLREYIPQSVRQFFADGSKIVAVREGSTETSVIMRQDWLGQPVYHRLLTNGFSMSGTGMQAKRYMRLYAFWPAILRPEPPRNALVISYGVGVTASAARDLASLEAIDVVDISPDIVELSHHIYTEDSHPLRDPRVRLHIEDGRHFLLTTNERYDLITGEPPPPRLMGAVNLYTREYFELIRERLTDGGVTTYWLPIADLLVEDTKAFIRAFCDVFDDCTVWNGTPVDWMLVGFRGTPEAATAEQFTRLWHDPVVGPQLREIGFEQPEQLVATFIGDAAFWAELTAGTPPLTDDRPKRLHTLYREPPDARLDFYVSVISPPSARGAFRRSDVVRQLLPAAIRERAGPYFELQQLVNIALSSPPSPLPHIEQVHALLQQTSLRTLPLWLLGSDAMRQRIAAAAAEAGDSTTAAANVAGGEPAASPPTEAAAPGNDPWAAISYTRGLGALADRDFERAVRHFQDARERGWRNPVAGALHAYALCMSGRLDEARAFAAEERLAPGAMGANPTFWSWLQRQFDL